MTTKRMLLFRDDRDRGTLRTGYPGRVLAHTITGVYRTAPFDSNLPVAAVLVALGDKRPSRP